MKQKRVIEAPVIDKNYLNQLYSSIHDKINILHKLNEDFKVKQEEHFIRSFLNVVEKMGNDLILAQEAYRNIDIEAKRDEYCMELATELQFFRSSCFQLKTALQKSEKSLTSIRIEKENIETELDSLHLNLEKKIKENMYLKTENKDLVKKLKHLTSSSNPKSNNNRLTYSIDGRITQDKQLNQTSLEDVNDLRMLMTQGGRRKESYLHKKPNQGVDDRLTDSQTPNELLSRFDIARSNASPSVSFRRRPLQKTNNYITGVELFK